MVMAPGFSVYCMQWDSWPDHVYGQQVEVTGVLNQTDQFQARVSKDGSISQGSAGADLILTEASFVVIEGE